MKFNLKSEKKPKGSQPTAIKELISSIEKKPNSSQTLVGVTGSGKTFTVANVINRINKPALVIAHNKTLAAQLYNELKILFPDNRVEYFVSYYDYYQPESYIPSKDQYIEKDSKINQEIEMMRLSATASLLTRRDVIIVASVSCIYGLGNPENYEHMGFEIKKGQKVKRKDLLYKLVSGNYERNDLELMPGRFRVRGETIDLIPSYMKDIIRIETFGDEIDRISHLDKITGNVKQQLDYFHLFPATHFVIPEEQIKDVTVKIKKELDEVLPKMDMLEKHRLKKRTMYDIEMLEETGICKGIENYSRFFDGRKKGEKPYTLLDYFKKDFLLIIDESHQTLPQIRGMYNGDRSRKETLVEYGFRLPSALDNRPLHFEEFKDYIKDIPTIFVSATPGEYELTNCENIVEQIIRPTGLIDPEVEVRAIKGQIEDIKKEIKKNIKKGNRILLTTITKKLAEELTEFLASSDIKARYLHSEIDTLERNEIIRELRLGEFDVLVGINLLREGLDIPEVGFIGILDADKQGFLRDKRSLIQTIGRAARNVDSKVILYADKITDSIRDAMEETRRRREMQIKYNTEHNITPKKIVRPIEDKKVEIKDVKHIPKSSVPARIIELEKEMKDAANNLEFERAIFLRNTINDLKKRIESKD